MSKTANATRRQKQLIAVVFGAALLTYLIRRAGPARLLESIASLGWGLALVIAVGGLTHLVKTLAWRLTLIGEKHDVSFLRMLALRLGSEAVGQLGFLGTAVGETLRVSLLSPTMPIASGISSVTLDRALFIITATAITVCGLIAALITLPLSSALELYGVLFAIASAGLIFVMAWAVNRRWPVLSRPARVLGRIRYLTDWMQRNLPVIDRVENQLLDFCHEQPGAFWSSFSLNVMCHGLAILEVYIVVRLMGLRISFFAALVIEALTKLVNIIGLMNPGNVGTYEGGNVLIGKIFGLSPAAGLTLAFARRARALFWAAVGSFCLVLLSKSNRAGDSEQRTDNTERPTSNSEAQAKINGQTHVAVILADNLQHSGRDERPLARVGTLPILLRAILGARKAGAARIIVRVSWENGWWVQRDLLNTRRLPRNVEWLEVSAREPLTTLLRRLSGEEGARVVLIAGDRTYHPSLHRRAAEWAGEGLALMTGEEPAGIYAFSRALMIEVANRCSMSATGLSELHQWLISRNLVTCDPVSADQWQRTATPQECQAAERKLDRWLYKATDGIFARLNRRVSVRISRRIMNCAITPNMISLFTLAVSFVSGLFFALGGYWHMLTGALLSLAASVLDGCDGEIARLKLQESDFGTWLDTICDYLYYLFIFGGMAVGFWRSSGKTSYLAWAVLLFFGAISTFLATSAQRRKLATGRPEQYLRLWQSQAESRKSNPFLYFGRHTEFIMRRCFLPYALLFFAVLNITNVFFISAAVVVNVVWPIALYSYLTFSPPETSKVAIPAASV